MKHLFMALFSFIFISHVSLVADETMETEDALQEEIVQNEGNEEGQVEAETQEVDTNAQSEDELEAAHAEEAELREVGAGEEPMGEE